MKVPTFGSLERWRDHGLVLLRVGLGAMMIGHGWPKIVDGPERWERLGAAMGTFGIDFTPAFWGFMAAASAKIRAAVMIPCPPEPANRISYRSSFVMET